MKEVWKDIEGYEGLYQISNLGRVKSFHKDKVAGKVLMQWLSEKGYCKIALCRDSNSRKFSVHRLVAQSFVCPEPSGKQVNHKDGIKSNNCVANLEWVTAQQNVDHAESIGLRTCIGVGHHKSKLEEEDVISIRQLYKDKEKTQGELGEMFGVDRTQINRIIKKRNWRHI